MQTHVVHSALQGCWNGKGQLLYERGLWKWCAGAKWDRACDGYCPPRFCPGIYVWSSYCLWIGAFSLSPASKTSCIHEIFREAEISDYVLNPGVFACPMDEDFIGRTATISRCISPRIISKRTLERYLCHIQLAWARSWGKRSGVRGRVGWWENVKNAVLFQQNDASSCGSRIQFYH